MMVICKRSEQGRWLERNTRETGGGEAETGWDKKKSAPVFARDMTMRRRKLLHMNLAAA